MTKSQRHVALLVEDDPEMAAETIELLRSFDHDCIHAATKVEAVRLIETGEFCYALLDLEIKVDADSIRARVEAGESVLDLIRERYPRRNEKDAHLLPVLMVSGHSDIEHVTRSFKQRADDFIAKPIGDKFKAKLEEALRKSGRLRHEDCAAVTRRARRDLDEVPHDGRHRLVITARQQGQRFEVTLDTESILITASSLVLLLHLVVASLRDRESWVHKADLGATDEQGWKGMARLKADLQGLDLIENNGKGGYRLQTWIALGAIDVLRLSAIGDARITRLVTEIGALQSLR